MTILILLALNLCLTLACFIILLSRGNKVVLNSPVELTDALNDSVTKMNDTLNKLSEHMEARSEYAKEVIEAL